MFAVITNPEDCIFELFLDLFPGVLAAFLKDYDLCQFRAVGCKYKDFVDKWVIEHSRQKMYGSNQIKSLNIEDIGIGWQNVVFPDGSLISSDGAITETMRWNHDHNSLCEVCGTGGEILLCDFCNLVYHLGCLQPPLFTVPEGDWACPSCKNDDKRCPVIGSALIHSYKKKIFLTGGYHIRSFTPCYDIYELNARKGEWVLYKCAGDCPTYGFGNDQAFTLRKHIYAFSWTGNTISSQVLFENYFILSMKHFNWSKLRLSGYIPEPRIGHSLAVSRKSKTMYLFGGLVQARTYKNDLYSLDLKDTSWKLLYSEVDGVVDASAPTQRSGQSLTLLRGQLWVIGGVGYMKYVSKKGRKRPHASISSQKKVEFLNDVCIWDILQGKWLETKRASGKPVSPRSGHSTVAVGNHIVIYGGCNSQKYLGDWCLLHTQNMVWSQPRVEVTPTPRMRASFLALDKSIILFGGGKRGYTSSPAVNVEKYRGGMYRVSLQTDPHCNNKNGKQRRPVQLLYENDGDTEESKSHRAA
mmetsp:Transcript_35697/g.47078  ORF Transcript_35697/g.47078 Transcript_35697/m.47078 type:complete len:525 (-) Transcript_35697:259-1833(-)